MLKIFNLNAKMDQNTIIKDFSLTIPQGEVHAIMGPNGSGKSTLANVLAGNPLYQVTSGSIEFNGEDLLKMPIEERSLKGLFLAMQYPTEIPGVSNQYFIKTILNAHLKYQGKPEIDAVEFLTTIKEQIQKLKMPESLLKRSLNEGFSGGEKKCNEILQLMMLQPRFAILDETDSGLDIDTLKRVADSVNALRSTSRSFLIITHYDRLLNYIVPDKIHIMIDGKIALSGDQTLSQQLEQKGYAGLMDS